MDDQELRQKLETLEKMLGDVYASAEKMRKYFLWTIIISVLVFVVPLIGLLFTVPSFLSSYSSIASLVQ